MEKVWLTEGPADVVERWMPRIVVSKLEIKAALTAPRLRLTRWLVHYLDGASVEVWSAPPATEAEILARRPEANAAQSDEAAVAVCDFLIECQLSFESHYYAQIQRIRRNRESIPRTMNRSDLSIPTLKSAHQIE